MTTYDASSLTDVNLSHKQPWTIQKARATRDNPIAMMEGADGAPRLQLAALPRLVAGGTTRSTASVSAPGAGTQAYATVHSFGFSQGGTIRCRFQSSGSSFETRFRRTRAGSTSTLSSPTTSDTTVDVSVKPGDIVTIQYRDGFNAATLTGTFSTDGVDLWPSSGANVQGNSL